MILTLFLICICAASFHFFQIKIISNIINISIFFVIFTKNGRTKPRKFQTCYLCPSSRDILSESFVKYTEINQFFKKNCGPFTFLFCHVVKGCHTLHGSHLLPLSRTYLQVLEQWNFLVSNFTLLILPTLHSREYIHVYDQHTYCGHSM